MFENLYYTSTWFIPVFLLSFAITVLCNLLLYHWQAEYIIQLTNYIPLAFHMYTIFFALLFILHSWFFSLFLLICVCVCVCIFNTSCLSYAIVICMHVLSFLLHGKFLEIKDSLFYPCISHGLYHSVLHMGRVDFNA